MGDGGSCEWGGEMIDFENLVLRRLGKDKSVFVIPSLCMDNPGCQLLFHIADCLDDIAVELREYAKEII